MLLTKLHIPNPGANLVHRTSLFEKLNQGLSRKLILVSASAGFGKTTALSDWIHQKNVPAAWFSIDNNDNDLSNFLSYIISGVKNFKKDFGESAIQVLQSPTLPNPKSIVSLLINDMISIDKNLLLVLDDFHLINNQDILKSISYLLDYMPENFHLALISRSDPNLPLAKLRSQQQMVELRSTDLSFTANDIAVLFNKKLKTKLSVEDIFSLETKTEGWIAGLQLALLSMEGYENTSEFISAFAGNNRYIMDYLMEEVLRIQSDEVKNFLLKTSLLEQFSAPLCNSILNRDNSQDIIEELEYQNMFVVPLDSERKWYRYHHLFADLLRQRLMLNKEAEVKELNSKASLWFEQNKMYDQAIYHSLKIKDYNKGIQLVGNAVESMWKKGQHAALLNYGEIIPDEFIIESPEFCLYYSWILISSGQLKKAKPLLENAKKTTRDKIENKTDSNNSIEYHKKLLGKISVAFAFMYSNQEHSEEVFDYCKTAMENLAEDDPLWFSLAWFSYGISYFAVGNLEKSNKAFNNAYLHARKTSNVSLLSTIVIRMAECEQQLGKYKSAYHRCKELLEYLKQEGLDELTKAEWNYGALYQIMGVTELVWMEFDSAYENIKTAYELCKNNNDIYLRTFNLMVYTVILQMLESKEADIRAAELEEMIEKHEIPPFITSFFIGWKLFLLIDNKKLEEAKNLIAQYDLENEEKINHINETAYASYVRYLVSLGKLDEAETLLSKLYKIATKVNSVERLIDLKNVYALIRKKRGDDEIAVKCLMEAMEIASEENLISYFGYSKDEEHFEILEDVFKIQATRKTNIPDVFIHNLKLGIERAKKLRKKKVNTDLSTREIDTLKLIAEELSNQEIADKLFISLNTVKTHLKNIYLKLEVDSRTKAVVKAKESGLLNE